MSNNTEASILEPHELVPVDPDIEVLPPLPAPSEGQTPANKTDEVIQQQVVRDVLVQGFTITATAEKFSLNRNTVAAIVKEYRQEISEIENIRLSNKFHNLADRVLDELQGKDLSGASVSQLSVLAGICVDKKIQLTGKPAAGQAGGLSLKVAWKDGSGAVQLTTGRQD